MLSKCIHDAGWFPTAAGSAKADLSKKTTTLLLPLYPLNGLYSKTTWISQ